MSLTIQWGELTAAKKPLQLSGSVDLAEAVKERADLVDAGPLHVQVQATYSSGVARVQGEAEAEFKFQCSRCLEPFKKRIRFPLREMFTKDKSILEAETEDLIHLVGTDEIDLAPVARENALLELPIAPICQEHCAGLCPVCGQNLNEATCGCEREQIDPRLAGLKDFFK